MKRLLRTILLFALCGGATAQASTCLPIHVGYDAGPPVRFFVRADHFPQLNVDRIVEGADAATLTPLTLPGLAAFGLGCPPQPQPADYAKDGRAVYYQGRVVEGADPSTFELIDYSYAKDKSAVYSMGTRITSRVREFGTLAPYSTYATDGEKFFFEDKIIDEPALVLSPHGYALSPTRVYFEGRVQEGIDASQFNPSKSAPSTSCSP